MVGFGDLPFRVEPVDASLKALDGGRNIELDRCSARVLKRIFRGHHQEMWLSQSQGVQIDYLAICRLPTPSNFAETSPIPAGVSDAPKSSVIF